PPRPPPPNHPPAAPGPLSHPRRTQHRGGARNRRQYPPDRPWRGDATRGSCGARRSRHTRIVRGPPDSGWATNAARALLVRLGDEAGSLKLGELVEVAGTRSTRSGMETIRVTVPARKLGR